MMSSLIGSRIDVVVVEVVVVSVVEVIFWAVIVVVGGLVSMHPQMSIMLNVNEIIAFFIVSPLFEFVLD